MVLRSSDVIKGKLFSFIMVYTDILGKHVCSYWEYVINIDCFWKDDWKCLMYLFFKKVCTFKYFYIFLWNVKFYFLISLRS